MLLLGFFMGIMRMCFAFCLVAILLTCDPVVNGVFGQADNRRGLYYLYNRSFCKQLLSFSKPAAK